MADQESIISKIQKLMAKASNNPFSEEADTAMRLADKLMTQHMIEQWQIDAKKPHEREEVSSVFIEVCGPIHPAKEQLGNLCSAIAKHCRCQVLRYDFSSKTFPFKMRLYGFPTDLRYAETLWTTLEMQLVRKMRPERDPDQTEAENLARMKESGMKWQDIHRALYPDVPWERRHGVRYTSVYRKFCEERGGGRVMTSPDVFVRSFVDGFFEKVWERLREIKKQRDEQIKSAPGTDIVLKSRDDEITAAVRAVASGKALKLSDKKIDGRAKAAGIAAGAQADLGQTGMGSRKAIG